MEFNQHIVAWYRDLNKASQDDKADFEVMLMDKHHDSDAVSAVLGIMTNQMQNGFEESLFRLLTKAAKSDNLVTVRGLAINGIIIVALLNDHQIRQNAEIIEDILDALVDQQTIALAALIAFNTSFKRMAMRMIDIRQTLIYRLVVVGEKANQAFDRSCC